MPKNTRKGYNISVYVYLSVHIIKYRKSKEKFVQSDTSGGCVINEEYVVYYEPVSRTETY